MEYIFIAFIALVAITSTVSGLAGKKAEKNSQQSTSTTPRRRASKSKTTNASSTQRQELKSNLNTDYHSRLSDCNDDPDGIYAAVEEIGDEDATKSQQTQTSLVDISILYGDENGNIDTSGIATAIILGEVLGKPKGRR